MLCMISSYVLRNSFFNTSLPVSRLGNGDRTVVGKN